MLDILLWDLRNEMLIFMLEGISKDNLDTI